MSDPARYRSREEVQKVRSERDPIDNIKELILKGKHSTEEDLKKIDKNIKTVVNEAAEFSKTSPEPSPDELFTDIYSSSTVELNAN